ncbi:7-deoxyloganetin glucosyltransferase [Bienertia sinuspersici]
MEIDVSVKRSDVERQVIELMEGEKGKDMKRKAMEWKVWAQQVVATPNGTSHNNLDMLIKMLKSLK